ncbi:MAG: hypothetical protein J2O48_02180 [Solirubrobacterales bacterium]|nr:hypothetical protein [Solirubrobacterales bacterium]
MRAKRSLRAPAAAQMAAGVLALALPATALAVSESDHSTNTANAATSTTAHPAVAHRQLALPRAHARLAVSKVKATAQVGKTAPIRGHLSPSAGGRPVELQVRDNGHWVKVAHARTHSNGAFELRYTVQSAGSHSVRVSFPGDSRATKAVSKPGSITGLHDAVVSWYNDAGNTACGFHATYGIASRTLPCGTHVTFNNGGKSLVATVDDRGPYVYSRQFDLSQTTAQALGMSGVATVLSSI